MTITNNVNKTARERALRQVKKLYRLALATPFPGEREAATERALEVIRKNALTPLEILTDNQINSSFLKSKYMEYGPYADYIMLNKNYIKVKKELKRNFYETSFYKDSLSILDPKMIRILFIPTHEETVVFKDEKLEKDIRKVLRIKDQAEIKAQDMLKIKKLNLRNRGIKDLTGLEFAKNLESLNLANNPIEDIHCLKGLRLLRNLNLKGTHVKDTACLADCPFLRTIKQSFVNIAAQRIDRSALNIIGAGFKRKDSYRKAILKKNRINLCRNNI